MTDEHEEAVDRYLARWAQHAHPSQVVGLVVGAVLALLLALLLALVLMAAKHGG